MGWVVAPIRTTYSTRVCNIHRGLREGDNFFFNYLGLAHRYESKFALIRWNPVVLFYIFSYKLLQNVIPSNKGAASNVVVVDDVYRNYGRYVGIALQFLMFT